MRAHFRLPKAIYAPHTHAVERAQALYDAGLARFQGFTVGAETRVPRMRLSLLEPPRQQLYVFEVERFNENQALARYVPQSGLGTLGDFSIEVAPASLMMVEGARQRAIDCVDLIAWTERVGMYSGESRLPAQDEALRGAAQVYGKLCRMFDDIRFSVEHSKSKRQTLNAAWRLGTPLTGQGALELIFAGHSFRSEDRQRLAAQLLQWSRGVTASHGAGA